MGFLDDAIREHLDLKRRRGGDPAEIERAEQEALGPVRREPIASEEADELIVPEVDETGTGGLPAEDHPVAVVGSEAPISEIYGDELGEEPPVNDDDREWDEPDDFEDDDDEVDPGHHDPSPDAASRPSPPPPAVPAVESSPSMEPGPAPVQPPVEGEDDVLEETPEFLQDTPDHDRLWFEQRPPRDFDFDE
jgi:hypothetical protein